MDCNKPIVYTYANEYRNIEQLVLAKPDIETGGDLFGLWLNKSQVVLQIVGGPGKGCRRTTHSFFQDVEYLSRTGKRLTQGEGLCNVGEWHSHHRLGLPEPSGGDQRTVWTNMPQLGLTRFVLLIANISGSSESPIVNINAFLFDWSTKKMVQADFSKLSGDSPLRKNDLIFKALELGKEGQEGQSEIQQEEGDDGSVLPKSSKSQKRRARKRRKKEEDEKQKGQRSGDALDEKFKTEEKIPRVNDSIKSEDEPVIQKNNNVHEARQNMIESPTYVKAPQPRKNQKRKNKNQNKTKKSNTKNKGMKSEETVTKSSIKTLTHASKIIEFTSQLCNDLDDQRFVVKSNSLFDLSLRITSENGSDIILSFSKSSTEGNALPEITLTTTNVVLEEQLSSWTPSNEEANQIARKLRNKLETLDKGRIGGDSWWEYLVSIWKTVEVKLTSSNCVIL